MQRIMNEYPPVVFYGTTVSVICSTILFWAQENTKIVDGAAIIGLAALVTAIGGVLIPIRNQNLKMEEMRKAERLLEADRLERAQNFQEQIAYLKNQNRLKDQKIDIIERRINDNTERIKGNRTEIDILKSDSGPYTIPPSKEVIDGRSEESTLPGPP